jgi:hypothetical protein
VAGGRWSSSGAGEEGKGAVMELGSAIMPPLGPTPEAVAMALWPRHQWVGAGDGCTSTEGAVAGSGWASFGVGAGICPSSSPGANGWPTPGGGEATARHLGGVGGWPSSGADKDCRVRW